MKFKRPSLSMSYLSQAVFVIREIVRLIWSVDKKLLILVTFLSSLWGLTVLPNLYITKHILDIILGAVGSTNLERPLLIMTGLLTFRAIIEIVRGFLSQVVWYYRWQLQMKMDTHMDILVGSTLRKIDAGTVESPEFNDRLERIRRGYNRLWSLTRTITEIPDQITGMISTVIPIFFFNKFVVAIVLLASIPGFFINSRLVKESFQLDKILIPIHRLWDSISNNLTRPSNLLEPRLLDNGPYLISAIKQLFARSYEMREKQQWRQAKLVQTSQIPVQIFTFGFDLWLFYSVILQTITLGTAQMVSSAGQSFKNYLASFLSSISNIYDHYLYMTDLVWFTNLKSAMPSGRKIPAKAFTKNIEFKDVWFKYPNTSQWILKGVSFSLRPNENLAIIGENGAGKTTMLKLLARFYFPNKGEVLVNGVNIKDYDEKAYWKIITLLFQDFEKYPYSVRESICMGEVSKINSRQKIEEAAKKSGIADYIDSLPKKYETPLSKRFDGGVDPSGGQWQRIALARAFLRTSAKMIILDEPTSSVDPEAEEEIFNQVLTATKDKSLFLISHRFSTVRLADHIIVLDGGKIVESGTHEELMASKGEYSKLYDLQAKWYK